MKFRSGWTRGVYVCYELDTLIFGLEYYIKR